MARENKIKELFPEIEERRAFEFLQFNTEDIDIDIVKINFPEKLDLKYLMPFDQLKKVQNCIQYLDEIKSKTLWAFRTSIADGVSCDRLKELVNEALLNKWMPETLTDEMLINGVWVTIGEIINAQGCNCDLLNFDKKLQNE